MTKKIYVISTGGTITGIAPDARISTDYTAGAESMQRLIDVLSSADMPEIEEVPLFSIDSAHAAPYHWKIIAHTIQALAARTDCQGIIVSHGTDTLEETGFFLSLTISVSVPVVLVAAMRPMNALSADGPQNFVHALQLVLDASANQQERGILLVWNEQVLAADKIYKIHTHQVNAFATTGGMLAIIRNGNIHWQSAKRKPTLTLPIPEHFPKVEIVLSYAGAQADWVRGAKLDGLVIAGTGQGTMSQALETLVQEQSLVMPIICASRISEGGVWKQAHNAITSGNLTAYQARVLLMVLLANKIHDPTVIQAYIYRLSAIE